MCRLPHGFVKHIITKVICSRETKSVKVAAIIVLAAFLVGSI